MITVKDIEKTIKDAAKMKLEVTVRDISYVFLSFKYSVKDIAYKSIFEKDANSVTIEKYDKSKKIQFLKTYIASNFKEDNIEKKKKNVSKKESTIDIESLETDITFEENKAALVKLLQEVDEAIDRGDILYKDGTKMKIDIRSKLNDKFKVSDEGGQQYIIVERKFNFICPHLQKECYIYTKEDLMEEYGLVEKNKE